MTDNSFLCTQKLRIPKPTPFGSKMLTPYQKYQMELQNNMRILTLKFPNEPFLKVRQLLQELDNDIQMVQDLLQQQSPKIENQNKIHQCSTKENKLNPQDQNKILKKAIASLYCKLKSAESGIKNLQQDNEKLTRQKQFYKNRAKLLQDAQFSQEFPKNFTIF